MNSFRRWMMLCEMELPKTIILQAAQRLIENVDWSGGGGETVMMMLGYDNNEDDYEAPDTNSTEFKEQLLDWAEGQVVGAYDNIKGLFNGETIRVYRMITAPPDWQPDPNRHPGDYWSWAEDCAEAHWGSFNNGDVKWMLAAEVQASQIDWVQTLAVNGTPDSKDECEINTVEDTPIKLLSYKRVT